MENNDKKIFEVKNNITLEEFKKKYESLPIYYLIYFIFEAFFTCLIFAIISIIYKINFLFFMVLEIIVCIFLFFTCKVMKTKFAEKDYYRLMKKVNNDREYIISFYQNYFVVESEHKKNKYEYFVINKIIETDTNFYIKIENLFITVIKDNCDLKLIEFIRNINKEKYVNKMYSKKTTYKKNIKLFMKVFLILSIVFLVFSISLLVMFINILDVSTKILIKKIWIICLLLNGLFSVILIILGYMYGKRYDKNRKNKNFISGLIILFSLLALLFYYSSSDKKIDYDNIYKYQNIINVTIPKKGIFIIPQVQITAKNNIEDFKNYIVYFKGDEKGEKQFEKEIRESKFWHIGEKINDDLKKLIGAMDFKNNEYYLIYNDTEKEYNSIPISLGKQHIYCLSYNEDEKELNISEYYFINKAN